MKSGCYTAIITPFQGESIDYQGLDRLVDFQIQNGITGILAVGTTGESPALSWDEHNDVIQFISNKSKNKCLCIAGTGSNNTTEALEASRHAISAGVDALLLVDPYYNGPSSIEIRREYVEPVAEAFPDTQIIPYIIPGRTGTQLLPEDLALAYRRFPNVCTVKEATGNLDNMRRTRECCGPDFCILSGDDALTCDMMMDSRISASGVISVLSNIVPGALVKMVELLKLNKHEKAVALKRTLEPLFDLVTVKTIESTPYGDAVCRARNPLAIKTLMAVLGLPSGGCRKPLGKMTRNGLNVVLNAARSVQKNNPELFDPIARAFEVDIDARLNSPNAWIGLCYDAY
ncbi:MAG TPA: 4-hydroxy-tetrahydrodipicolinate synthase [Desulfatirhabdiaceae bacterium]|nr:4-hydroxy-tetrahydrodipicolinate synthase [Desulfatirhabdiaceae bacterium]